MKVLRHLGWSWLVVLLALLVRAAAADQWRVTGGVISETIPFTRSFTVTAEPVHRTIVSARVQLRVTHPWVGDLRCVLRHPCGAQVVLLDRSGLAAEQGAGSGVGYPGPWGCGGDNIDVWFDDAALAAAETTCPYSQTPVLSGALRPLSPLANLAARSPLGVWTLTITDLLMGDTGSVETICVELITAVDCNHNGRDDAIDIEQGSSVDVNADGVPDECACSADVNHDAVVNAADLALLLSQWGSCSACSADLTADSFVQADDLAIMLSQWGVCVLGYR